MAAAAIVSFVTSVALIWIMQRFPHRLPQDVPNERSLHERPVLRTGGLAILGAVCMAAATGLVAWHLSLLLALVLGLVSFADDLWRLPTSVRLAVHLAAAGVLVWYVASPMAVWKLALLWLAVGWITNVYNFMDGSDGLAGGMSVIGFGAYAFASSLAGDAQTAAVSVVLSAANAGFLLFNFHPARIFLGDAGSIPQGFLAAALGMLGWRNDAWPLWFPVLVFGPFIGDATITLLKRVGRGGRFWAAHREHYYQRMVRMGLGHRGTACVVYSAMIVCALAALYGRDKEPGLQAAAFLGASAALGALALWVDLRWAKHCRQAGAAA
jgi:UDP-N-acetylmuramyl pentapeptide phosphotransferase/UDP-N-acetylglucosamine-1-phosphate transferase